MYMTLNKLLSIENDQKKIKNTTRKQLEFNESNRNWKKKY